jgi:hypothetical protein
LTVPGFFSLEGLCDAPAPDGSGDGVMFQATPLNGRGFDIAGPDPLDDSGRFVTVGASESGLVADLREGVIGAEGDGPATAQIAETYRLVPGGFPRERIATLVLAGKHGEPCQLQAHVIVQGT